MVAGRFQGGRLVGVGVLLFGVMALLATLWLIRPGDHPLAGTVELSLCDRLDENALLALAGGADIIVHREVPPSAAWGESCRLTFTTVNSSVAMPREVLVSVMTTAQMRRISGMRSDTQRYVETFVAESRASGMQVEPAVGPWREGWLMHQGESSAMLIAEDRGVVLIVNTQMVPRERLLPFIENLALQLQQ